MSLVKNGCLWPTGSGKIGPNLHILKFLIRILFSTNNFKLLNVHFFEKNCSLAQPHQTTIEYTVLMYSIEQLRV